MKRCILTVVCFLAISACAATEEESKEEFTARLPDGTVVELVALRNYSIGDLEQFKDRNYPWWRPDGTAIVEPPDTFKGRTSSPRTYWFVIGVKEGEGHDFKAVGPYGGGLSYGRDLTVQPVRQKAKNFERDDLRYFSLRFLPDQKQGDIELGLATGDWKVTDRWSLEPDWTPYNLTIGSADQIVLRCPEQVGSDVVAEVTQIVTERATRLVLFDRDGNQYESGGSIRGEGVGLLRYIHRFKNFDRKEVEHVEFQARPYEYWITFRNISLQVGHETRVAVDIKQPGALLEGNSLPGFDNIDPDFAAATNRGGTLLICFFDMNQRPSRRCIGDLAKQAEQLKEKGVAVVAIQASKISQNSLDEWTKHNSIPFPVGMIARKEEITCFTWGVRSLPWLILADSHSVVIAGGFGLSELDDKIRAAKQGQRLP